MNITRLCLFSALITILGQSFVYAHGGAAPPDLHAYARDREAAGSHDQLWRIRMPRIRTAISIGQSIDRVFEFVTTVSNFPKWHPSSWTGPSEHPLRAGEQVTEELSLGGRHARIQWIVRESSPPRRWVIGGKSEDGGTATITYTLKPESQGTRFKREFVYNMPALFGELETSCHCKVACRPNPPSR